MTGIRERRRKQLLVYLKETRGYCKLKEDVLYGAVWRTAFGRVCGPVGGKTADRKNKQGF